MQIQDFKNISFKSRLKKFFFSVVISISLSFQPTGLFIYTLVKDIHSCFIKGYLNRPAVALITVYIKDYIEQN